MTGQVHAAGKTTVNVDNYYYAYADQPGDYPLQIVGGSELVYGDFITNDAYILEMTFEKIGFGAGDRLYVIYQDNTGEDITSNPFKINRQTRTIRVHLDKKSNGETLVRMTQNVVDSPANGGTEVTYNWTKTPPQGGDLGNRLNVPFHLYYVPFLDQYRLDYTPPSASRYQLQFTAANGSIYEKNYMFAPTGIHYLTCNGNYRMYFYDSSGKIVAQTEEMITSLIQSPSCNSYADRQDAGKDDLGTSINGENVSWNPLPNATKYEVYKDGQKIGETSGTIYNVPGGGSISVVARNGTGQIVGRSDLNVSAGSGGNPSDPPPDGTCGDVCQNLKKVLTCPDWPQYMGSLTQAIKDALPPPPDWQHISEIFAQSYINALNNYLGEVPEPPTVQQITDQLPQVPSIDSSFPEAENLKPQVSQDFNQPFNFDITSGPQIEVVDNSRPFDIVDPLQGMETSGAFVPVMPGDPQNHAGGIKLPETVQVGDPQPTPKVSNSPVDPLPTPKAAPIIEMPIPSTNPATLPTPINGNNPVPIPTSPGGNIPIPRGG